jgi:hypothetical protein
MYTFGEVTHDPHTGRQLNAADRLRDLIEEIELRQGSRAGGGRRVAGPQEWFVAERDAAGDLVCPGLANHGRAA